MVIKDKKTGAVIAENAEEGFWYKNWEHNKQMIKALEAQKKDIPRQIRFHKEVVRLCEKHIRKR